MSTKNISLSIPFSLSTDGISTSGIGGSGGSGCNEGGEDKDWLRVEQVEYRPPSLLDFELFKASYIDDTFENNLYQASLFLSPCDGEGNLPIQIEVYTSRADLPYTIKASYGSLSLASREVSEHDESFTLKMQDCIPFGVEVLQSVGVTAEWEGDVVSSTGDFITPKPEIHIGDKAITIDRPVTGTLRVQYTEEHDVYTLTIPERPNILFGKPQEIEKAYTSTIAVVWEGGVEVLELDVPEQENGTCGSGGSTKIYGPGEDPPDDDDDDEEKCVRITEIRNPCTEELISTKEEEIECPSVEERIDQDLKDFFGDD